MAGARTGGPWPHRLALATAAATATLIFIGGLVTSTGSGLAVPDWPTTFGQNMFLYPPSQWVGGILYEHSHRLLGALVGLLTVALAVALWGDAPRGWLRWVGLLAVAAVIGQGVLGGLRVVLLRQTLAVIHGIVAQAFFALVVALAVWTSKGWEGARRGRTLANVKGLRRLCAATSGLLFLQTAAGVLVTHTGTALHAHLAMGALAALQVFWMLARVLRRHWDQPWLVQPARALAELLMLQLLLGVGAYLARFTAFGAGMPPWLGLAFPLAHRLVGTLLWGTSLVLTLRVCRLHALPRATVEVAAPIWQEAR